MKATTLTLLCLMLFGCEASLRAQGTGVRTEYMKGDKMTKVETNMLYVTNTPKQFIEIQLGGLYKGEKLTSAPKLDFTAFSFSKEPFYKKDKDRSFAIIVDGVETPLGTLTNTTFKGETKNGVDSYFAVGGNPNVGMQVPVPQSAAVRAGGTMTGMTMEWITLPLKPEQFLKLAASAKIQFRIGSTVISPTDRHIEVIHNFVEQLTQK